MKRSMLMLALFLPSFPLYAQVIASLPEDEMVQVRDAIAENIPEVSARPYFTRLLVAIRKSENGGPGREYGVLHPKANTYRKQCGWSAAICWKRYEEWKGTSKKIPFLVHLANRYAPVGAKNDPLEKNRNWLKNVRSHMGLKGDWEP